MAAFTVIGVVVVILLAALGLGTIIDKCFFT